MEKSDWQYENMPDFLQDRSLGNARIEQFTIFEHDFRAIYRDGLKPGKKYVRLMIDGEIFMSDAPMEKESNYNVIDDAFGDILLAGLGIGLILLPMQKKEEVKSITVVEKNPNVIDIVGGQLPLNDKVEIIHADIFDYEPIRRYDCIYLDIWPDICKDNAGDMSNLIDKYSNFLTDKPDSWCKAWQEDYVMGNMYIREGEGAFDYS
ncbi:class I SAM-dependent methyltransferase [Selenomonas ruminantium]|uniref:class I SAM-dependent methyltransferase n=1 Tax=Selenomonas ruminantium TaxID=971 RepID=UPI0026EF2A3C|nr:class I SAM-dependent methyltransferase [Selenomonas ruminantium]